MKPEDYLIVRPHQIVNPGLLQPGDVIVNLSHRARDPKAEKSAWSYIAVVRQRRRSVRGGWEWTWLVVRTNGRLVGKHFPLPDRLLIKMYRGANIADGPHVLDLDNPKEYDQCVRLQLQPNV